MNAARDDCTPTLDRAAFRRALLAWYRRSHRDLPWRRTQDPYRIWLSEILLQQTRVETAQPYYERFTAAFPNVMALASAPLDDVLRLWAGLGYYTRARNLHKGAQAIVGAHNGQLPRTAADWQQIPGVGRYTAGAIASIAYGEPVPVVDGNVKRVLARVFRIETPIDDTATVARLWTLAEQLVPRSDPGDFNQALMELGARICTPRRPQCDECPLRRQCAARAADVATELPTRRPRRAVPQVEAAAALLTRDGRYLLVQRPPAGLLAGLWTLPTVELTNGTPVEKALQQHLRTELGLTAQVGECVATIQHQFTHRTLRLRVYACATRSSKTLPRQSMEARWVPHSQLHEYICATVDRKMFAALDAARPHAQSSPRSATQKRRYSAG